MKRVGLHEALNLDRDAVALLAQVRELLRQPWQHQSSCVRADHDHGLLRQRLNDLRRETPPDPRGELDEPVTESLLARRRQLRR